MTSILMTVAVMLAADWPQYRGPNGAGIAEGPAPVEFGPTRRVVWSAEIFPGHSSPSIWGDHVVLTGFDAKSKALEVIDLERATGRVRWRRAVTPAAIEKVHDVSSPANGTAAIDGERIYVFFGSAGLFCWDLAGREVWKIPIAGGEIRYGHGTSPIVAGEAVILARDDNENGFVMAVDRKTGREIWKAPIAKSGSQGHATPVIWRDQVVVHLGALVRGYRLRDGAVQWSVPVMSEGTGTPAISNDMLFVGASFGDPTQRDPLPDWNGLVGKYDRDGDGLISKDEFPADLAVFRRTDAGNTPGAVVYFKKFFDAFDQNHDGKLAKQEWETALQGPPGMASIAKGLVAMRLGGDAPKVAWSEERSVPEVPAPLVYRGRVFAVANGGIATVLDQASGKVLYRGRVGAGGLYYASPVAAGGRVYFASGDGVVTVIDAAADEMQVIARNDFGDGIFATPAIADGRIYVRAGRRVYAIGE